MLHLRAASRAIRLLGDSDYDNRYRNRHNVDSRSSYFTICSLKTWQTLWLWPGSAPHLMPTFVDGNIVRAASWATHFSTGHGSGVHRLSAQQILSFVDLFAGDLDIGWISRKPDLFLSYPIIADFALPRLPCATGTYIVGCVGWLFSLMRSV